MNGKLVFLGFFALFGLRVTIATPFINFNCITNRVTLELATAAEWSAVLKFEGPISAEFTQIPVDTSHFPPGKYVITAEVTLKDLAVNFGRSEGSVVESNKPVSRAISATLEADGNWAVDSEPTLNKRQYNDPHSRSKRDNVINDDLIVTGSACIGFDCANGESFGADTVRLKENNLRIRFQDTSNTGSFPSNDWQITANDQSNGGQNKFSIDDIDGGQTPFTIEAGARSHSLYVDSNGKVGAGTDTPATSLHTRNGNTPALRLEQDSSSGFASQSWDVAGNEANYFVRDVTHASKLPLRIKPNSPTNSLFVSSTGGSNPRVGIGLDIPSTALHIKSTEDPLQMIALQDDSATAYLGVTPEGGLHVPFQSYLSISGQSNNELNNRWRFRPGLRGLAIEQFRSGCNDQWVPTFLFCRRSGFFSFNTNDCVVTGNQLEDLCT